MDIIEYVMKQGGELHGKRTSLLTLWQTIAENFYPERADFTVTRSLGDEFADNLMSSYPVLARRDLGNSLGSMLRPTSKEWKHTRTQENYDKLGKEAKAWLEWADKRMTRAMYNKKSMFTRATKEGDHDFATFGQCVIQVTLNREGNGLLYRTYHLRDVAWMENEMGVADTVYRKWKPTATDVCRLFPKTHHPRVKEILEKTPYEEIEVWHAIIPAEYSPDKDKMKGNKNLPYRSIYIDVTNKHIMEDIAIFEQEYVIPRWQTVSGSQYAYSPSTTVALPDARLIQSMTLVLLEAGEKAVTPPMLAVQQAIRGDISLFAGGITWVDGDYDDKLGSVLQPINIDKSGIPTGMEMMRDTRAMITEAFYLNKITLPQPAQEMTAYEVGQRVQEYIRQAMPLFEPMEAEYNGPLCEITFSKMMRAGAFGSPSEIPKELQGENIEFLFESPLHDAVERQKGQRFMEAAEMLGVAINLDPSSANIVDANVAIRDVLSSIGVPAKWQRSETEVRQASEKQAEMQETQQMMAMMDQGANIAKTVSEAQAAAPANTEAPAGAPTEALA
jgi:hypothetical protein